MKRYRWPGYELQLLAELQRQQNSTQFCDTVLQTGGISVPTHSCVLAALSPYLSQKLSACPSPPFGQKRQLQLKSVKAQTLVKLVGLLYSGELYVKKGKEQDDVLAAAHQFGITDLVEEQRDGGMKAVELQEKRQGLGSCRENGVHTEGGRQRHASLKMQDAHVQADMAGRRESDSLAEKRSCVSTCTQTVKAFEKSVDSSVIFSDQTKPLTPEPASCLAPSLDVSISLQPENITFDEQFSFRPCPAMSSDRESTFDLSSGSIGNPTSTSALCSETPIFPVGVNDSDSSRAQEDDIYRQSSESGDSIQAVARETGLEDRKTSSRVANSEGKAEQTRRAHKDETLMEDKGNSTEKRHAHTNAGVKNLAKMQQMMETTQISIKVKLRRRTEGEVWEVVSMQDTDETLSVLTSLKQDRPEHKTPQADLQEVQPPPSTVHLGPVQKPQTQTQNLEPAAANFSEGQRHPNTDCDSQPLSGDCFTSNLNSELESVSLLQNQGSAEESDEQIERLLEDIMMGLNILPNLERDCKKPQPSHDGALTVCQVPVTECDTRQSPVHTVISAAGCVFYQDLGTQMSHSPTDTAQDETSFTSLSTVQQQSPQHHSSIRSVGQSEEMSCDGMPPSEGQSSLYPEVSTTSVVPSAFFSSWQKRHYPAFQQQSSQEDQHISEFLPLSNESETQSEHSFSLPCMDDLRLPRCLSPLEPCTSTAHQPFISNSTNFADDVEQQPSLHGQPWLSEKPTSLQFPFSANSSGENTTASPPQVTNQNFGSKDRQKHMELRPKDWGTCTATSVEERRSKPAEVKSDPKKINESLKCKQGDTTAGAVAPEQKKRKLTNHPEDAVGSFLAFKDAKVNLGTKNFCSVSLSSNNVLLKEREMPTSSANMSCRLAEKQVEKSTVSERVRKRTRRPGDTERSRIRTRSFVKKSQETERSTVQEKSSLLIPGDLLKSNKRGRPPKAKLEESPSDSAPATAENKSRDEANSKRQTDQDLPKEENKKTNRWCRKRRRNTSEVEVVPLKKTTSAEYTGKAEADNGVTNPSPPERPRTVTLKAFQQLIKRQPPKPRKSKGSQETNETVGDVESEVKANKDGTLVKSAKQAEVDVHSDGEHNPLFNKSAAQCSKSQQDDANGSTSEEASLFGEEDHPQSSVDVLGEEVSKLSTEREQPLKNPDEGSTRASGSADIVQSDISGDCMSSDTHLPRENEMDHNSHPQTPEKTGPTAPEADGIISSTSGCNQEEEEEEEEEVDVLLYSPDKVPQTRVSDVRLNTPTPDEEEEEEEEEDVNEIDVTGDEAE